jgi:putative peptidoglycan lipid II flippase
LPVYRRIEPSMSEPRPEPAQSVSTRLARSAGLIGTTTLASRVLGLVREQVMAYLFGAGNAVDAFNVAFRIPNLVRDLLAEGAMSAAFVPAFTKRLQQDGREAAFTLGSHIITALLVITVTITAAASLFATPLVTILAGDYAAVPGKLELAVVLTRVMLPFLIFVALAAAAMGMLNSLDRYFVPALAPAVFNVCSISATVALVPLMAHLGWPTILAMAFGVLAGGIGQVGVQWPALRHEGFRYRPMLHPSAPGLREVLVLLGPGTLGLAATQINVFVNTWLATGAGTGAVSWLNYAFRLMYLPLGLFGVSIATASIPAIARGAADRDLNGIRHTLATGVRMMLALNIPATLGLIALAHPIVTLLFERGRFTPADSVATANALICYAVGLTGYSVIKVATPTFYALGDSRTPVIVSTTTVLSNAALNLLLVRQLGYRGLAIGTSVAALANAGLLLWLLRRRLEGIEGSRLLSVATRQLLAGVVMAIVAWIVQRELVYVWPGTGLAAQLARVGLSIASGLVTVIFVSRLLGVRELTETIGAVARRVRRGPPMAPEPGEID